MRIAIKRECRYPMHIQAIVLVAFVSVFAIGITAQANDDSPVLWTKPDDLLIDLKKPMKPIQGLIRPKQLFFSIVMGDGSTGRFKTCKTADELANLSRIFSHNDGEVIDYAAILWEPDPK